MTVLIPFKLLPNISLTAVISCSFLYRIAMISGKDGGLVAVAWFWVVVGSVMAKEYFTLRTIKFRWR